MSERAPLIITDFATSSSTPRPSHTARRRRRLYPRRARTDSLVHIVCVRVRVLVTRRKSPVKVRARHRGTTTVRGSEKNDNAEGGVCRTERANKNINNNNKKITRDRSARRRVFVSDRDKRTEGDDRLCARPATNETTTTKNDFAYKTMLFNLY